MRENNLELWNSCWIVLHTFVWNFSPAEASSDLNLTFGFGHPINSFTTYGCLYMNNPVTRSLVGGSKMSVPRSIQPDTSWERSHSYSWNRWNKNWTIKLPVNNTVYDLRAIMMLSSSTKVLFCSVEGSWARMCDKICMMSENKMLAQAGKSISLKMQCIGRLQVPGPSY